jgi:hypothetical protein
MQAARIATEETLHRFVVGEKLHFIEGDVKEPPGATKHRQADGRFGRQRQVDARHDPRRYQRQRGNIDLPSWPGGIAGKELPPPAYTCQCQFACPTVSKGELSGCLDIFKKLPRRFSMSAVLPVFPAAAPRDGVDSMTAGGKVRR